MNRPNHIRKAKSLAQKYNQRLGAQDDEDYYYPEETSKDTTTRTTTSSKESAQLFDKINKIFEDPSIKELKEFDHDDFLDNGEENASLPTITSKPKSKSVSTGKDALDRAKSLLEKKQDQLPAAKEKQKKKNEAMMKKLAKENTFVTGVGLYSDAPAPEETKEVTEQPPDEEDDDDDEEYEDFDEDEYLKQLHLEDFDDLAELRKMIAATKKEIQGYAGEVFNLKNSISDLNIGYKDIGYGVDEDLFTEMDREFNRFMPGGDTKKLFDDIANKNKNSQQILSIPGKKNIKKNNLFGNSNTTSSISSYPQSLPTSSSQARKPPIVKQPVLDKLYGNSTTRVGELQPISGTSNATNKQLRNTFF